MCQSAWLTVTLLGYHRAALVIWPHYSHYAVRRGVDGISELCEVISQFSDKTSRQEGGRIIEWVLRRCASAPGEIAKAVCQAAIAWNSPSLWEQAVTASSKYAGAAILQDRYDLIRAVKKLGLDGIKAGYVFVAKLVTELAEYPQC